MHFGALLRSAIPRETAWFRELVAKYRKNKVSRNGLLEALELFAVRMSDWKTADQTLFAPYPQALVQDADQERYRDYRKAMSIPEFLTGS